MKVRRYKHARRFLSFYKNNYQFRPPYQILIDGTFTNMALQYKINLKEQIPKYIGEEVQLLTTKCAIAEMENLGSDLYGAMSILTRFKVRKCPHHGKPVGASECLLSMLSESNSHHYFIATQDPDLSRHLRKIPAAPLLYINFNAIVLEKPSMVSQKTAESKITSKLAPSAEEKDTLKKLKQRFLPQNERKRFKKKRPKGPNPLSVKKKKKKQSESNVLNSLPGREGSKNRKRKRRKKKLTSQVE
ncbi:rRNA-processing protein UTP23 homolog [Anneissia japonica]|uniref:rRNA-processing protein UTP23 homolog n=1 Tax=Anneissia japonica TaxID=1529436 RepID=UPI001425B249|nr:rRNA-processing protein UTP23 homolog [Anneissia japonica]XP_033118696.1 rRNA-processing protein UTP23 homolog [Anneissia japonica]XP_033118697.1 rRNA-processing protein UTP23 homolog [Anneissia japonica]